MMLETFKSKFITPVTTESDRANNFNIIRFIAAIMVVYSHMGHIIGGPVFSIYNQAVSTIGVKIFFLISGYLITKSYMNDSNIVRYLTRRVFRIFPALIAIIVFSTFIVGPIFTTLSLNEYFHSPLIFDYLKNIFLKISYSLPGVFQNNIYPNAVNGSLWTLPVEFAMYLLLPAIVVVFKKLKILKQGILAVAVVALISDIIKIKYFPAAALVIYNTNLYDWLTLVPFFFIGALFTFPEIRKLLNLQWATGIAAVALLIGANQVKSEIIVALVLPYFIFSFALAPNPIFANWFSKNDYSYGMYLYGFLIQQLYSQFLGKHFSVNIATIICVLATFAAAFVSWHLIEKPCQKLGKKIINGPLGYKSKC
ncbi:MAG: acyltransferase [Oscillospiraceae bacterium]